MRTGQVPACQVRGGFSAVEVSSKLPSECGGRRGAQGPKPGVHSLRLRGDMMDETGGRGPSLQAVLAFPK